MAVTHYDLTATFRDAEWTAFDPGSSPVVAWVETNVANTEGIVDEVANQIALGGSRKVADSTGLVTWTDLVGSDSDAADINLESGTLQYRVTAEYRNAITRRRERWVSGWFSLTADINLADVISETYVPAAWMTTATATLQTYVDDAAASETAAATSATEAAASAALADSYIVADLNTSDGQMEALIESPTSLTSAALSATYVSRDGTAQTVPTGERVFLEAEGSAMAIRHDTDKGSAILDLVDMWHRSTGDAICIYHEGGRPSGWGGATGDRAGVVVIVPENMDHTGSGREGTAGNTKTGQVAFKASLQPTANQAIGVQVDSWSDGAAIWVRNQVAGNPVGNGRAVLIDDGGTSDSIYIQRTIAPAGSLTNPKTRVSAIRVADISTVGDPATPIAAVEIADDTGTRLQIDGIGTHRWAAFNASNFDVSLRRSGIGQLTVSGSVNLEDNYNGSQQAPTLGLYKYPGNPVLLVYGGGSTPLIEMKYGTDIGFFGAAAVSKPTGVAVTAAGIHAALVSLGLIAA